MSVFVWTDFAWPLARFVMQLPGRHHHGFAEHLADLLLRELLVLLLRGRRTGWRQLTLRQRGLRWSLFITNLEEQNFTLIFILFTLMMSMNFLLFSSYSNLSLSRTQSSLKAKSRFTGFNLLWLFFSNFHKCQCFMYAKSKTDISPNISKMYFFLDKMETYKFKIRKPKGLGDNWSNFQTVAVSLNSQIYLKDGWL